jgi:hypothetical protein
MFSDDDLAEIFDPQGHITAAAISYNSKYALRDYSTQEVKDIETHLNHCEKCHVLLKESERAEKILSEPVSEQEISCSVPGCLEKAFTCQCIQHYNELLEKNAELAEDLGEKKCHCSDQNHIMEPIA